MENTIEYTFETGKTYEMRWITDSDLRTPITIEKRTAKTATVTVRGEETKRCKIHTYEGREYIKPMGSYSMAPILSANNLVEN